MRRWPTSTTRTRSPGRRGTGKLFRIDLNGQYSPRYDKDLRFGPANARVLGLDALEAGGNDGPVHVHYKPPAPRTTRACGSRPQHAGATT